jgi:uncharacterized DUF497 family protein
MYIVWNESKNELLKATRGVSFEEVAQILEDKQEIALIKSPVRVGQEYYIVRLHNYIHVVPAVINADGEITLKTIFPSRKYEKIYGGNNDEV